MYAHDVGRGFRLVDGVSNRLVVVVAGVWGSIRVGRVRWSVGLDDWGRVSWGDVGWGVRLDNWGGVSRVGWGGVSWGSVGVRLDGDLVGVSVGGSDWGVVDGWGYNLGGHVAAVGWGGVGVRWVGVAGVRGGYIAGVRWGGVATVGWGGIAAVGWGSVGVAGDWSDVSGRDGGQERGEGDDLEAENKKTGMLNNLL